MMLLANTGVGPDEFGGHEFMESGSSENNGQFVTSGNLQNPVY